MQTHIGDYVTTNNHIQSLSECDIRLLKNLPCQSVNAVIVTSM